MAFQASWGNLPQGNFVPEIFSKNVLKFFRRAAVVDAITNNDYYGEISNYGDTVRIIKEPTIAIGDYSRGQQTTIQEIQDDETTLTIDKAKYFAFGVDDIESKQSHVNWETLATSSGAYSLKNDYDKVILNNISGNVLTDNVYGTDGTPIDMGFDTGEVSPLSVMSRLSRLLDEQDVPEENRWFVASPAFWEVMADENSKLMGVDFTGDSNSKLRNGRVTEGLIRGFECYKTNNAPVGSTSAKLVALAGHKSAVATASQIAKTEAIRSENFFGDIVRGLHMYGDKTLRSEALAKCFYSID